MDILEKIVEHKKKEVAERKIATPLIELTQRAYFKEATRSLQKKLRSEGVSGIIAEHKRKSPSLGWISEYSDVVAVTTGYEKAGASCLSILTDNYFFGGSTHDLMSATKRVNIPILRKDFIIDEYQVFETKAMGADVMLLIAECLTKKEIKHLAQTAKNVGLEVILELHDAEQLDKICDDVTCVGINNRNLKTFTVSIQTSIDLVKFIPDNFIKISESGISRPERIAELRTHGFKGFLIGEAFMKTADPAKSLAEFIGTMNAIV